VRGGGQAPTVHGQSGQAEEAVLSVVCREQVGVIVALTNRHAACRSSGRYGMGSEAAVFQDV